MFIDAFYILCNRFVYTLVNHRCTSAFIELILILSRKTSLSLLPLRNATIHPFANSFCGAHCDIRPYNKHHYLCFPKLFASFTVVIDPVNCAVDHDYQPCCWRFSTTFALYIVIINLVNYPFPQRKISIKTAVFSGFKKNQFILLQWYIISDIYPVTVDLQSSRLHDH